MNSVFLWSVTVALAGFLFGFDTAVISGADQPLQTLWQTSDWTHGFLVMSSALWGTVIGALLGNWPCDHFGRKKTLFLIGVLYLLSALGSALANDPYWFSLLRFIGGLGVGISSIAAPAYISEVAPTQSRGRLVALYQFQIVFGILVAFSSNYVLSEFFTLDWRWMLGIEALPAILFVLLVTRVPESPRWLLLHKNDEAACRAIIQIAEAGRVEEIIDQIKQSATQTASKSLWQKRYSWPIILAFAIAFFNQVSGINFIIYFAPRVFSLAGLDESAALLSSAGIGIVNLVATLLGMMLIDRLGRRQLLLIGSIGYIATLSAVSWAFATDQGGMMVVLFVFGFIAAHAVGQGAVIWVFIAEIFPNEVRSKGQALGSSTHWVLAASIALVMPAVLGSFEAYQIFAAFALMMAVQLVFVIKLMPETRNRSLEEIAQQWA